MMQSVYEKMIGVEPDRNSATDKDEGDCCSSDSFELREAVRITLSGR